MVSCDAKWKAALLSVTPPAGPPRGGLPQFHAKPSQFQLGTGESYAPMAPEKPHKLEVSLRDALRGGIKPKPGPERRAKPSSTLDCAPSMA